MLKSRNLITDENCFFITTKCYKDKFLFFDETCFDILIENFEFYNKKYKSDLLAYVLMNNHIHFILYFYEKNHLENYLRDFKKYTSLKIREYIQNINPIILDDIQYNYRTQKFKIWEDSFDDICLFSKKVCEIKVEYIHENPCKAGMVKLPEDYKYSSASFYEKNTRGPIEVVNFCDIF
jgi:putative transposase